MDEKRIQRWSNASQHVLICFQPFTSYSEILVGNCNFLSYPLHLTAILSTAMHLTVVGVPTVPLAELTGRQLG